MLPSRTKTYAALWMIRRIVHYLCSSRLKFLCKAKPLSWNRGVPMASRRGHILLAVFYSRRVWPMRLATVATQVPFQLRDVALYIFTFIRSIIRYPVLFQHNYSSSKYFLYFQNIFFIFKIFSLFQILSLFSNTFFIFKYFLYFKYVLFEGNSK